MSMKRIVILGAGTAGTMMANKLRKSLSRKKWDISIIDEHESHYYQPGFLFIPFGIYKRKDVEKPKAEFIPNGVNFILSETEKVDAEKNEVILVGGEKISYDILLIATGTQTRPEETTGLKAELWYKEIFDFYTIEGAVKLQEYFNNWKGGKLVMAITELPYKCPVAPLEFVFLADSFFTKKGIRDKVEISYVTPMSGAFTKPIASKILGDLLVKKNIKIVPDFYIESVDNSTKTLKSFDGKEVPFDCLTVVPVNMGSKVIERSGLGDDMHFVPTNKFTLQSEKFENIFVIGDATNIPTSKAGSVAHFAGEVLIENMLDYIKGKPMEESFDGHTNCYIETGFGKASLIDFNYTQEPLPGVFPFKHIGPFKLLGNTRMNHWGKMMFKWIYWNILIKGREMPLIDSEMTMKGKKRIPAAFETK